jgi:asparagine synthase (glutamine-hydrolysing)
VHDGPLKAFTVRFPSRRYDEGRMAAEVARHLRVEHVVEHVAERSFVAKDFWRVIDSVGLPFFDSSALPVSLVSAAARRQVTVCLSGDGGDEMFAGYPYFRWHAGFERIGLLPQKFLRAAQHILERGAHAPWLGSQPLLRRGRRLIEAARLPERFWPSYLAEIFGANEALDLLKPDVGGELLLPEENLLTQEDPRGHRWSRLRRMMAWQIRHGLEPDMLVKIDRMSMAHSLEVRAPFLDPDVAGLAARLPDDLLIRQNTGKWVVREAMRGLLPEALFQQPKWGFSIPLHLVQNEAYRDLAEDLLLGPHRLDALFSKDALGRLMKFALDGARDDASTSIFRASHQLWALMQLFGWVSRFDVAV